MKRAIYGVILAAVLTSCGHSGSQKEAESDSIAVMDMVETVASEYRAYLTKDSIGSIWIGQELSEIPDSVPGLYNKKEPGATPDAVSVVFRQNGEEEFVAYDFGEGKIDVLNVIGSGVKIHTPHGEIGLGDSFAKVFELPGVKAEWSGYDESGMWYWTWEGIWFAPDQTNLPKELSQKLYHSGHAPTEKDFIDSIGIGFIGTGLPF